jgi:hypothetical protein
MAQTFSLLAFGLRLQASIMRDHTKLRAFELADEVVIDRRVPKGRDVWTDFSNTTGSGFSSF